MSLDPTYILSGCLFGSVALFVMWLTRMFAGDGDKQLRARLSNAPADRNANGGSGALTAKPQNGPLQDILIRIGQAAAKPFMPETREKQSELRRRLAMAGIYAPGSIRVVTGFKVILLGGGLFGGYVVGSAIDNLMMALSVGGLVGYLLPTMWLRKQVKKQQQALDYGLPDALDLMVVCVEAGLAVDAAMERVGEELKIVHPRLSREFDITFMETRVGLSRSESLKNFGTRTACASVQSLVSMLIQAERFGTSVAGALRVHGESLRILRQQRAEEMAAKSAVKMSFPLVLFIFPATFIVLAGPTIVELLNSSLFN